MPDFFKVRQGAGAGSAYIAVSFGVSGVLTFRVPEPLTQRFLGVQGYAPLALLWSATFLTVQVLWIGATQTLGRYVAEREARGEDWGPVVSSVRRWQIGLAVCVRARGVAREPGAHETFRQRVAYGGVRCGRLALCAGVFPARHLQRAPAAAQARGADRGRVGGPGAHRRRAARRGMGRVRTGPGHRARPSDRGTGRQAGARAAARTGGRALLDRARPPVRRVRCWRVWPSPRR